MEAYLGPRRTALLREWGTLAENESSGANFDFSEGNRTVMTQERLADFLAEPTRDRFEALWQVEVLADAVVGGIDPVLNRSESVDAVAQLLEEIDRAEEYDPGWESRFLTGSVVWEVYGRLHPEREPIVNSTIAKGLDDLGFPRPTSFAQAKAVWADFMEAYDAHVGHATAGTDHEVPLHHEMSECLWFIAASDEELVESQLQAVSTEYAPLRGWREETELERDLELRGHMDHVEGYIEAERRGGFEADGPADLWNQGYWEDWKDAYLDHIDEAVRPVFDVTDLTAAEVEPFLDALDERTTLSTPIPRYLLGGQMGAILWREFQEYSVTNAAEAAEVLSYLFDPEEHVTLRLDRFGRFYGALDTTGGPLMSLATTLLTFVYPRDHVFYKYSLLKGFFETYSDYEVRQGFNPSQYWKLNVACREQLLVALEAGLEDKEPTLLDVYSLLYVWNDNYDE